MSLQIKNAVAKTVAVVLTAGALWTPGMQTAQADMIATPDIARDAQLQTDRASLQQLLARTDVADYLTAHGVNPADVQNRINNLSEAELTAFQNRLGQLPAGGDGLGVVVAILVIFILLDVAGVTDIFPGV